MTLPSKNVSLAECLNSRKENGNDKDDESRVEATAFTQQYDIAASPGATVMHASTSTSVQLGMPIRGVVGSAVRGAQQAMCNAPTPSARTHG